LKILLVLLLFILPTSVFAIEAICPGGASPASGVVWCDDFEDGTWSDWDASAGYAPDGREAVKCTNNSFGFQDKCAAYSGDLHFDNAWGHDNHYGTHMFPSSYTELHLRMYLYFSNPYPWGSMTDKGIYLRNSSDDSVKIRLEYSRERETATEYFPGSGKPAIGSYAFANPGVVFQNQGNDITFQPGKWYLVEFYVKLNDPGVANGIVKFWVDDASLPITSQTLRLSYNNILIRGSGNNSGYNMVWLTDYREDCRNDSGGCAQTLNQWVKWDNVVVRSGNNQIGPQGSLGIPNPPVLGTPK